MDMRVVEFHPSIPDFSTNKQKDKQVEYKDQRH